MRSLYAVARTIVYLLMAAIILCSTHSVIGDNYNYKVLALDMVDGAAYRPYVYRTLLPTAARLIVAATPAWAQRDLNAIRARGPLPQSSAGPGASADRAEKKAVVLLLMYLCFVGYAFAARRLFAHFYDASPLLIDATGLIALLCLPPAYNYVYLYDPATLFLFTLGLVLMARERWFAYIVIFLLSCANKETTILLTLVFAVYYRGRLGGKYRALIGVQVVGYLLIQGWIRWVFRHNPGGGIEFHLLDFNVAYLHYSFCAILGALAIAWLLCDRLAEKPPLLRDGLWMAVPLASLALFFGNMGEWRDFYEVYPVVIVLAIHSLAPLFGLRLHPRVTPQCDSL